MEDKKEENKLETFLLQKDLNSKSNLSIEQQKTLLLLLKMRKDLAFSHFLIKKIKKNIANFETLRSKNKNKN